MPILHSQIERKEPMVMGQKELNEMMQRVSLFQGYSVNDLSSDLIEIIKISYSKEHNKDLHIALELLQEYVRKREEKEKDKIGDFIRDNSPSLM